MTEVQDTQASRLGEPPSTLDQRDSEIDTSNQQPAFVVKTEVIPGGSDELNRNRESGVNVDEGKQSENLPNQPNEETGFDRVQRVVSEQVVTPISQMWRRASSQATNVIHPGDLPQPGQMVEKLRQSLPPASGVVDRVKENIPRAKEMIGNLAQTIPQQASGVVETLKQDYLPQATGMVESLRPQANKMVESLAPQANEMVESLRQGLPQIASADGATSEQLNPETLKKQAVSLYTLTAIPAAMTIYRTFLANEGPTWFSFHPMMMMVSVTSMLTAMLLQRFGGKNNITLIGTLSVTSIVSMIISLYAVWSAKEMYGKVHFLSMHSHFGGMSIFGLLVYALGAFYVFKPTEGTERADRKWQQYLVTWGKGTATVALCSQLLGVIEVERTWSFLFIWMASLMLLTPFVILPWNKES